MLRLASAALLLAMGAYRLSDVPLSWRPTDDTGTLATDAANAFRGKKVRVTPFTDDRQDKKLIGRNTEDSPARIVTTRDDVGAWCASQLSDQFREAGVQVVTEGADLVIGGRVTRFMVNEGDVYRGAVALELTVKLEQGKQVWTGTVTGEAKRWGRSYQEENYMETLSDALVRAFSAFVASPGVGGGGDAARGQAI